METLSTADSIMGWFTEQVQEKQPIDPHNWLEGAIKLSVLLQGEQEKLIIKEQEVAQLRKLLLEDGKTVAYAKTMIEASNEYAEARKLKAKIDRGTEFIRLCKLYSRTSSDLMKSGM
jgi:hypothetical protein